MATDEKYLDDLLKSLTEGEQQSSGSMDDAMYNTEKTTEIEESNTDFNSDEFADLFAETFPSSDIEMSGKEEEPSSDNAEDWQSSLDDLLAQADAQLKEESDSTGKENVNVTDLFNDQEIMDADLAEINGLLSKEDDNKSVEDDMLALLESVKDDQMGDSSIGGEAFDIFAENAADESSNVSETEEEHTRENPKERKLFKKGKSDKQEKKSKAKDKKLRKQKKSNSNSDIEDSIQEAVSDEENTEQKESAKDKEKTGFFSRMITYLTKEEDEFTNASDENAKILQELNEEDRKKSKKKEKKNKKGEKKKGKEEAAPEGEEEIDAEAVAEKKKKKKEKKKKDKTPREEVKEKPVRVLSKRNLIVLIAASATLIAAICVLSTFLTEYADKQNARQAFYEGDYEEAYRLLYDKHLNSNDSVIYNRVKTVLTIERKLDSYENNLAMNRELEALDALMQGISCYQELDGVDEYGVRSEVDAIYQQMCSILQNNYGITPEEAFEINTYDNDTYTRKLNSVINGTEFVIPGEEVVEEELPPQDILPEEEEIINY